MSTVRNTVTMSVRERKYLQKKLNDDFLEYEFLIENQSHKADKLQLAQWKDERNFVKIFLEKINKKLDHLKEKTI